MNIHFAAAWMRAFCSSPDDALAFYADDFEFSDPPQERFICQDKSALARAVRPLSNKDPGNGLGIHQLEVIEYIGDQHSGLVLWRWSATHVSFFFGLATHGSPVQTTGMSFHVYRNGKIRREIVYSDQIHVAQQLGVPVEMRRNPHKRFTPPEDPSKGGVRH